MAVDVSTSRVDAALEWQRGKDDLLSIRQGKAKPRSQIVISRKQTEGCRRVDGWKPKSGHACGSLGPNPSSRRGVEGVGKRRERVGNEGVGRNGGLSEKRRGIEFKKSKSGGTGVWELGDREFPPSPQLRVGFHG